MFKACDWGIWLTNTFVCGYDCTCISLGFSCDAYSFLATSELIQRWVYPTMSVQGDTDLGDHCMCAQSKTRGVLAIFADKGGE